MKAKSTTNFSNDPCHSSQLITAVPEDVVLEAQSTSDRLIQEMQDKISAGGAQIANLESRLHAIQEIGRALGSTLSLDQVLNLIMTRITFLMEADRSTLFLLDEKHGELWSKVLQGKRMSEIRLRVGDGIAGWVAQTGKSINIKDAYRDKRFNRNIDVSTGYQTRSCLCQPIRNQERRIIGVVQVLNKKNDDYFTVEDENLLSAIASQAAISIENSKLYLFVVAKNIELLEYKERLEQKMYELDLLYEIEREASTAQSLERLLETVSYRTLDIVDASACAITLVDPHSTTPTLHTFRRTRKNNGRRDLKVLTLSSLKGVAAAIIKGGSERVWTREESGEHYKNKDESDPARDALNIEVRSLLAVPFALDGHILGALQVFNKLGYDRNGEPNDFNEEDLKLLTLISSRIARSITTQLQREQREKAERLSAIGQMLASLLHDLKTPFAIIRGYVQLMARKDDRETREKFAKTIFKQFDTLNSMTQELLAFARGESRILLRKVFVSKLMEEVSQMLKSELQGHHVELVMDVRYKGTARLDEVKVKRAFANLMRNALEAMEGKGGRLLITVTSDGKDLILSFSDTGGGIPEKIRGRLFESFVTQGKKNGTGLGLAIVKKIVDEHEGTIQFESEVGRGTTFTIHLPLGKDSA